MCTHTHTHIYIYTHTYRTASSGRMQHACSVNMVLAGGGDYVSVKVCRYIYIRIHLLMYMYIQHYSYVVCLFYGVVLLSSRLNGHGYMDPSV